MMQSDCFKDTSRIEWPSQRVAEKIGVINLITIWQEKLSRIHVETRSFCALS